MTITKNTRENKCWRGCREKQTIIYCSWKCKLMHPLWKIIWKLLNKLKVELLYDPTIPLLSIHTKDTKKKMKSLFQWDIYTHMFIVALFIKCDIYVGESESEVTQSCPTLCDPMDCSLPGSSLHVILQARVLEWVAISFSRGSSQPRDRTRDSHITGRRFNLWATRGKCTN